MAVIHAHYTLKSLLFSEAVNLTRWETVSSKWKLLQFVLVSTGQFARGKWWVVWSVLSSTIDFSPNNRKQSFIPKNFRGSPSWAPSSVYMYGCVRSLELQMKPQLLFHSYGFVFFFGHLFDGGNVCGCATAFAFVNFVEFHFADGLKYEILSFRNVFYRSIATESNGAKKRPNGMERTRMLLSLFKCSRINLRPARSLDGKFTAPNSIFCTHTHTRTWCGSGESMPNERVCVCVLAKNSLIHAFAARL